MGEQKEPDQEYEEPTNKQLANFLTVCAPQIVGEHSFFPNPVILEKLLEKPLYREAALRRHRRFVDEMNLLMEKMERGQLQCEHIRANGKKCPNFNEPGIFYCGLHRDEAEE